jgi:hypothetical protein
MDISVDRAKRGTRRTSLSAFFVHDTMATFTATYWFSGFDFIRCTAVFKRSETGNGRAEGTLPAQLYSMASFGGAML